MRLITKVAAGTLLGFGLFVSLSLISVLFRSEVASQSEGDWVCYTNQPCHREIVSQAPQDVLLAVILLGFPAMATGSWMFWQGHCHYQQQQRDRLRSVFFKLLQNNNGQITAIRFAMAAGLDGRMAKTFLDDRAREFDAAYNISEEGNISYYFELEGSNPSWPDS